MFKPPSLGPPWFPSKHHPTLSSDFRKPGSKLPAVGIGFRAPKAAKHRTMHAVDSLRGCSVKLGTIQRTLAWPSRKDDTHKSRSVNIFFHAMHVVSQLDIPEYQGGSRETAWLPCRSFASMVRRILRSRIQCFRNPRGFCADSDANAYLQRNRARESHVGNIHDEETGRNRPPEAIG